jgi:hypothetical protein
MTILQLIEDHWLTDEGNNPINLDLSCLSSDSASENNSFVTKFQTVYGSQKDSHQMNTIESSDGPSPLNNLSTNLPNIRNLI